MNFWEARQAALSGKTVEVNQGGRWMQREGTHFTSYDLSWNNQWITSCDWRVYRDPEVHEFERYSFEYTSTSELQHVMLLPIQIPKGKKWKVRFEEIIE
jgi:hypothetical protein